MSWCDWTPSSPEQAGRPSFIHSFIHSSVYKCWPSTKGVCQAVSGVGQRHKGQLSGGSHSPGGSGLGRQQTQSSCDVGARGACAGLPLVVIRELRACAFSAVGQALVRSRSPHTSCSFQLPTPVRLCHDSWSWDRAETFARVIPSAGDLGGRSSCYSHLMDERMEAHLSEVYLS